MLDSISWMTDCSLQLSLFHREQTPAWAYFQVHHRRWIAKLIELRPETRVLLVIFEPDVKSHPYELTLNKLRHHIGHLRGSKLTNDCSDAVTERKKSRR